jgi:hypothetical protein
LIALGIAVLTEAAQNAEATCRQVVSDAEAQAAAIVREARDDVARLTRGLDPSPVPAAPPAPTMVVEKPEGLVGPQPAESTEMAQPEWPSDSRSDDMADPEAEIGNQFFDSFAQADDDPWSFMDDDLVGVGPGILRRVLRRPAAAPPQAER